MRLRGAMAGRIEIRCSRCNWKGGCRRRPGRNYLSQVHAVDPVFDPRKSPCQARQLDKGQEQRDYRFNPRPKAGR